MDYFDKKNIKANITYAGTLDMMSKINAGEKYDAIWASNSIWLYMLENSSNIKNSKSTSINPIVFAIKTLKSKELNLTKDIDNTRHLNKIVGITL